MIWLVTVLAFCLCSCASTSIYENGQRVFYTQADMTGVSFDTAITHFKAASINHSTPTLAGGAAVQGDIGAVAGLAGVIGSAVVGGPSQTAAVSATSAVGSLIQHQATTQAIHP